MKARDIIRVTKIPAGLPDESRKVFEFCLGKCFPIHEITDRGFVEVLAGRQLEIDGDFHTIEPEPGEFELAPNASPDEIFDFRFPDEDNNHQD